MLRVVLGCARPDTEWSGKISGLQFSSGPRVQESMRSRGAASTILTVPRSQEADLEPRSEPLHLAEGMGEMKVEKERI